MVYRNGRAYNRTPPSVHIADAIEAWGHFALVREDKYSIFKVTIVYYGYRKTDLQQELAVTNYYY